MISHNDYLLKTYFKTLVLTFLCTSVRIRYSAERSRLALRLGRVDEFNGSGENLEEKSTVKLVSSYVVLKQMVSAKISTTVVTKCLQYENNFTLGLV